MKLFPDKHSADKCSSSKSSRSGYLLSCETRQSANAFE